MKSNSSVKSLTKIEESIIIKSAFYRIMVVSGLWNLLWIVAAIAIEGDDPFISQIFLLLYVILEIISTIVEIQTKK